MNEKQIEMINSASKIVVIQAENPDGDSLGSALALEEILSDLGKTVTLYCPVAIPKYLRYATGWDRVSDDFAMNEDLIIIVDTATETLISKVLAISGARHFFSTHPVIVLDHHTEIQTRFEFDHEAIIDPTSVATGELIYRIAQTNQWGVNIAAAESLLIAIMSDSLGLTTEATSAKSIHTVASLVEIGANITVIESRRRAFMKKSPEMLSYKADLLKRIEYYLENRLAIVHIPWNEIQKYSDAYNPSVLVLDDMRLVENVELAIAIKTYPDGKLTGKLKANSPIADTVAGYFGGGGHPYAAGFRAYESLEVIMPEIIKATSKALEQRDVKAV